MSKNTKLNLFILGLISSFVFFALLLYLVILPRAVSSKLVQNMVKSEFYNLTQASLTFENPVLKTSFSPRIEFSVDNIQIQKADEKCLVVDDFDIVLSLGKIFKNRLELKKLLSTNIYLDVTNLISLFPHTEKNESKPSNLEFGFFNSDIKLDKISILYSTNGIKYDANINNISLSKGAKKNYLHFNYKTLVTKGENSIVISICDDDRVYIERDKLVADNCNLRLNESVVNINAKMDKKNRFNINVFSKDFRVENVIDIIESNILIPNGAELLAYFSDIKGRFDFDFMINNKGQSGNINLKKSEFKLVPVDNIPLTVKQGNIKITNKDIFLSDFVGFYEKHPTNDILLTGSIKDYMKTFDTNIDIKAIVTNDFMKNYLSTMVGYPIELVGQADTKLTVKMKNNIVDMRWLFWINADKDILVGGEPLSKYKLQRILAADMQIKGTEFDIKNLNYYVTLPDRIENKYKKILRLSGKIDFSKGIDFREMGFDISEPLPSEFLNMVARTELFKGGTVVGKLKAIDGPKGVKLFGKINLSKIKVPSQRIFVKEGVLSTNFDTINIAANGRYRRTKYTLDGEFVNNIAFPIIINKLDLGIDKIDIGKMIESMNVQGDTEEKVADLSNDDDIVPTFDVSNLIIKNCTFKMGEGIYNGLLIKDLFATMTLNDKSILELVSNKFMIADGYSSCNVFCDLKNHIYKVRLGVRDVDSNTIASSILGIKDEISGKARGLIDLHTDNSLRLNGDMKFEIKDGRIGTVGFLQYVLNIASIFRNPLAMISPTTIWELINIPKGEFNNINGTLSIKNNVIERIRIKSSAPQLSSYIAGSYDLENCDASLRIYTKFSNKNKGLYGVLRHLSLSSIANHLPLTSKTLYNLYNVEVKELPKIDAEEKDCQIFFTKVDGDIEHNNFISYLKRIK